MPVDRLGDPVEVLVELPRQPRLADPGDPRHGDEVGLLLVGEATRRASERAIAYADAGAHELKGKEGQTSLWRALRVVSARGGELRSEGLEAPFVGREREIGRASCRERVSLTV